MGLTRSCVQKRVEGLGASYMGDYDGLVAA